MRWNESTAPSVILALHSSRRIMASSPHHRSSGGTSLGCGPQSVHIQSSQQSVRSQRGVVSSQSSAASQQPVNSQSTVSKQSVSSQSTASQQPGNSQQAVSRQSRNRYVAEPQGGLRSLGLGAYPSESHSITKDRQRNVSAPPPLSAFADDMRRANAELRALG